MPWIHPKTWEDGVMPLEEFPACHRAKILTAVELPTPPPKMIRFEGCTMVSRAWYEWHWARGRKLQWVEPPGGRKHRRKLSKGRRQAVIDRDGYVCGICSGEVEWHDVHIDHIFPVSLGGNDELANLRVTHARCNMLKGAKV